MKRVSIVNLPPRKTILPLVMVLADRMIKELGFVEKVNAMVKWNKDHWFISPGHLAKMLVLSTFFDVRSPLSHLEDRFENIDVGYFLGEAAKSDYVNASNVGRALERIGECDYEALYETLAVTAVQENRIPATRFHADTTTISFYGEYEESEVDLTDEEKEVVLQIERGYNKDGKPQCKQVVVGQIVTEQGIPLVSKTLDGSTSDVEWNKEAVQYFKKLQETGLEQGIFVADSKLVTEELITTMNNPAHQVRFVSRCPANFSQKLEYRMIEKAYAEDNWEEIGRFHEGKVASQYKGISFIETVYGQRIRLLVLESSSLASKVEKALRKAENDITPEIKALERKEFLCFADAEKEIERFKSLRKLSLFDCDFQINKGVQEKWPRGRRSKNTKPKIKETYRIIVKSVSRNQGACLEFSRRESCIVIITNVIEELDNRELLKTYKGQQVVENSFRLLKAPNMASVIYLKNPARIQALSMVLTFSLLIRAIIQFRLREGLSAFNEANPDTKLYVGWNNRPLVNPTFKLLYEHAIRCHFEKVSSSDYQFPWISVETKRRVMALLSLMGLTVETLLE